jgi:uncharacterized protein with PhoU and TrkA domain
MPAFSILYFVSPFDILLNAMTRLNRIYKELGIALDGLKKGILEIAITTSENAQVAKLLFRIFELEKKVDRLYTDIGKTIYELRQLQFNEVLNNPHIKEYMDTVKTIQSDISKIEKEIHLLREDTVKPKLEELKQYMRRSGYTVEETPVEKESRMAGKRIGGLPLPSGVIVIAVIHLDLFTIPAENLCLEAGDRVFLLGPREKIQEVTALFAPAGHLA